MDTDNVKDLGVPRMQSAKTDGKKTYRNILRLRELCICFPFVYYLRNLEVQILFVIFK